MQLGTAKIVGALTLNNRILNYFPVALALKTRGMQFYAGICDKILTGLGAHILDLQTHSNLMCVLKPSYFSINNQTTSF